LLLTYNDRVISVVYNFPSVFYQDLKSARAGIGYRANGLFSALLSEKS